MKNQTKSILIVGILLVVALLFFFPNLFSIFTPEIVNIKGLQCDINSEFCDSAHPIVTTRVGDNWYLDYAGNTWNSFDNLYFKKLWYRDWELSSTESYEYELKSSVIWWRGIDDNMMTTLKNNEKTSQYISKYGLLTFFKNSYMKHNNIQDWWTSQACSPVTTQLDSWSEDYFIGKLCWVEFSTELGLIKLYGKNEGYGHLQCVLKDEYPISLDEKYVSKNVVEQYTERGNKKFSPNSFEIKFDFKKSEFPNIPNQTIECDNGREGCSGNDYLLCINEKWVNKGKIEGKCGYNLNQTCSNGDLKCIDYDKYTCSDNKFSLTEENSEYCGYEIDDEINPSENFFTKSFFKIGTFSVTGLILIILSIAIILFILSL